MCLPSITLMYYRRIVYAHTMQQLLLHLLYLHYNGLLDQVLDPLQNGHGQDS